MTTPRPFTAPEWDNSSKTCAVCSKAFGLMRRQHHCRNCGAAVCNDHSQSSSPIINLGFDTPVRVCDPCSAILASQAKGGAPRPTPPAAAPAVPAFTPQNDVEEVKPRANSAKKVSNCTCGMPLCICEEDLPTQTSEAPALLPPVSSAKHIEPAEPKPRPAPAQGYNPFSEWKSSGTSGGDANEQLRDAAKAGDHARVQRLLQGGANVNFSDDQGNRPIHLAAMLGHVDVVKVLLEGGAQTNHRNRLGELPADLAPVSLATKITSYSKTGTFA
eukprot:c23078_g1_i1.p1 GENE.c23078_g1_i1~~c23078_g1_i1.p1  ORF type:complete len:288 (-),score=57.51 c23078_g1_i1:336-1154(-)